MNRYAEMPYPGNRGFVTGAIAVVALFLLAAGGIAWVSMGIVANDRWPIRWLLIQPNLVRTTPGPMR